MAIGQEGLTFVFGVLHGAARACKTMASQLATNSAETHVVL